MQVLRQCCELCFAPNTVSRFVRIFPRAALFFLVLHIVILIITVINYANRKEPLDTQKHAALAEDDLGYVKLPHPPHSAEDNQENNMNHKQKGRVKRVDVVKLADE